MSESEDEWRDPPPPESMDLAKMDALVIENQMLWKEYEDLRKVSSEAYKKAMAHDALVLKVLEMAQKESYKVDGLGTIRREYRETVTTPKTIGEKKAFFGYLKSLGPEVLYSLASVNSASLNSWYKAKLKEAMLEAKIKNEPVNFKVPGIPGTSSSQILKFIKDRASKKGSDHVQNEEGF